MQQGPRSTHVYTLVCMQSALLRLPNPLYYPRKQVLYKLPVTGSLIPKYVGFAECFCTAFSCQWEALIIVQNMQLWEVYQEIVYPREN